MQKARGTREGGLHRQGPARTVLSPPNCTLVVFSKYLKPYILNRNQMKCFLFVHIYKRRDTRQSRFAFIERTFCENTRQSRDIRAFIERTHLFAKTCAERSPRCTDMGQGPRPAAGLRIRVGKAAGRDTIALCTLYELSITQTVSVYTMQRLFMFPQKCTLSISARARTAQCLPAAAR